MINENSSKEEVLAAVKVDGYQLTNASTALKNNREVVFAAVTQYGYAIKFASCEMRKHKDIMLAAVRYDGEFLHLAAENLQDDEELVRDAVQNNPRALRFASEPLQEKIAAYRKQHSCSSIEALNAMVSKGRILVSYRAKTTDALLDERMIRAPSSTVLKIFGLMACWRPSIMAPRKKDVPCKDIAGHISKFVPYSLPPINRLTANKAHLAAVEATKKEIHNLFKIMIQTPGISDLEIPFIDIIIMYSVYIPPAIKLEELQEQVYAPNGPAS